MTNHDSTTDASVEPAGPRRRFAAAAMVFIACACGWFMMELEILGVRVLVPYFGSAVYVITGSVIGVFLLSLSIGYLLGGWLSGKIEAWSLLAAVMVVVGGWQCGIPFFTEPVCNAIFDLGMDEKWGSLLASLVLFGVPTILLGTVSPTVMHWLTRQASQSGFNAGLVMATSTMASFAGCVVTAFYLVLYSLRATLCISGMMLSGLGVIVLTGVMIWGRTRQQKGQPQ
ncbi:fused MFS/spermidine synthase [Anaerohalosphaeraceae bacterium U12dextr]